MLGSSDNPVIIICLQGELIAESGTMSGGGGRPQRGRMALGTSAPKGAGAVDAKAAAAELKRAEQALEQVGEMYGTDLHAAPCTPSCDSICSHLQRSKHCVH